MNPQIPQEEVPTIPILPTDELICKCAWCLKEKGIPAGEGSHGICKEHADGFLIQWREQRSRQVRR